MTRSCQLVPEGVKAVVFDAVGTLIGLDPPVAEVYAEFGRRFGSQLTVGQIQEKFARAFTRQEEADRQLAWRTDEQREETRWRDIVREVISDIEDRESVFNALYGYFARPESWICAEGTAEVIEELNRRGLQVAMASNFDARLRKIVAGRPELAGLEGVYISSEIGYKKPVGEFYKAVCQGLARLPEEVLLVGDDLENDYQGALRAGMKAMLYDPNERSGLTLDRRLARLGELTESVSKRV